ncbi:MULTISPECIES: hypothetical protein [Streptomyces]|uniref:hypothetical protein n=1 Tax=Streptomyces TaxID=1883 RepID=UPI0011811FFB|nr:MULTISPECIES: hypothetical protein [Streptomyces]MDX3588670.1 hypothetical protein [Streptomyces europaeiscabiei]MDX3617024.1 hypothetical protein [Streptomyces europaeiscabiei]MDX3637578.1 hypothetical protein [Streptomyces europaeiscabiei]MDX3652893.1 hypothetical protein [Streptomyces europaeiscabiei]
MTDTAVPARGQDSCAAGPCTALAHGLDTGAWTPGPLERRIARMLLVACAGDSELTAERIRSALWEGAVALPHAGEGRLAALLAHLHTVAGTGHGPRAARTTAQARAVLERVAGEEGERGAGAGGGRPAEVRAMR